MATQHDLTVFDQDNDNQVDGTIKFSSNRPVLIMLDGNESNRRQRISKRELTIGREVTNDIVLLDNRSSRHHATLIYKNFDQAKEVPEILLRDLNSTNGTFVNGERISERLLHDHDKILLGASLFGFFLRDECELEADQRLYFLARNDALTGLLNRGIFNMEVQKEFERAQRYGRVLSLVMFDIDHFKRFNDCYGHQTGDYLLQELGRIVKISTRGHDICARYGGEEFTIILPETVLEGALIQSERLRLAVANHLFAKDETSLRVTISLGIATNESYIANQEDLIKAADRALYQAKSEGRNCICWMQNGLIHTDHRDGKNETTGTTMAKP